MQQFIKAFYPFWEVFLMVIWWSVARWIITTHWCSIV